MSITIARYSFAGPFSTKAELEDRSGVYAVLCRKDGSYSVLDVGEAAAVRTRVQSHDREDCWKRNCSGTIMYAALYTPNLQQPGRMEIEQKIRQALPDIPCGKR